MDTKTRPLYMLSTRDAPQNKGLIQTESEGLEKDIPSHGGSEKPGKLEVGGASRDSTGLGALEEGLISS